MEILKVVIPGMMFLSVISFFALGTVQAFIFAQTNFHRARSIGLFCFFSGLYSLNDFLVQARLLTPEWNRALVVPAILSILVASYYYLDSMHYFLVVPKLLKKAFTIVLLWSAGFLILSLFDDITPWGPLYDSTNLVMTDNYFINSKTMRIGMPSKALFRESFGFGMASIIVVFWLFIQSFRGSFDFVLQAGLLFSIFAFGSQTLGYLWGFSFYLPLLFASNSFEAFRMSFLSLKEFIVDKEREDRAIRALESKVSNDRRYQNYPLDRDRVNEISDKLLALMKDDQPYLNPNLRLETLAKQLGIPPYQLSQVLAVGLKSSFYDLVNRHRIEYAQSRLREVRFTQPIIEVAYESGFNSKSTFNTAFKKHTDQTPSQYRDSL